MWDKELAQLLKERENQHPYSPVLGEILSVDPVEIRLGDRITLDSEDILCTFDLKAYRDTDYGREYIYLGKTAVLLPYLRDQNYIVIGVIV